MSIPYFDHIHSTIVLGTPDGCDHGWMVIIARDPSAGIKNRYSVFVIDCQNGTIDCCGRELPIGMSKDIQCEQVECIMALGREKDPQKIVGWGKFSKYNGIKKKAKEQ